MYIIAGVAWIYGSDAIILKLTTDPAQLSELQSAKGLLFVLTTAVMLFMILFILLRQREQFQQESIRAKDALEKEVDSYTRTITHDLKAPIRAVIGFSSAIEEDYVSHLDPRAIDYLNRIKGAGEHLNLLMEDLLAFSRLSRKTVILRPVRLKPILEDMVTGMHVKGEPIVDGDEALIRLVLKEILANASLYTQQGKEAQISVDVATGWRTVTITIQDHGIGIEKEHLKAVFDLFKRLHSRQQYPGNGVGLAMAEAAMLKMKGDIHLESTVGVGTTVSLIFRKATKS
jgi:signal transduction histidine kinase